MTAQDEPSKTSGSPNTTRPTMEADSANRLPSLDIPDRLKGGDDDQEDMTAPPRDSDGRENRVPFGVFSVLAAAGSRSEIQSRFDTSSDSDDEEPNKRQGLRVWQKDGTRSGKGGLSGSVCPSGPSHGSKDSQKKDGDSDKRGRGLQRKNISEHKLFKKPHGQVSATQPKVPEKDAPTQGERSSGRSSGEPDVGSQSLLAPKDTPVLGQMAEARAQFQTTESPAREGRPEHEGKSKHSRQESSPGVLLSTRLREIFGFENPETVLAEYQCWLLQNILLQGYMYVTERHICFYAYLPKKSTSVIKSGYLSKRGRQNPKYSRYWCALKGDVLSYYMDPSNLYFPSGQVDLRYGISAHHAEPKDKEKGSKDFVVTTDSRTYQFRADSVPSAKEWVKALRKVIFRSHNDGDSVKISLPTENVIDIEDNPMLDYADTCKIRVVESGDSYAIDEYFFSFFEGGKEALNLLRDLVNDTTAQQVASERLAVSPSIKSAFRRFSRSRPRSSGAISSGRGSADGSPYFHESVRATLRPPSRHSSKGKSPRHSREVSRSSLDVGPSSRERSVGRSSFDLPKRGRSTRSDPDNHENSGHEKLHSSSESFVQSMEQGTESSAAMQSTSTPESASRILDRSDVFQSPTINRFRSTGSPSRADAPRHSQDTARSVPLQAKVNVQPPSRTQTTESPAAGNRPSDVREPTGQTGQTGNNSDAAANKFNSLQYSASSPTLQDLVKAGTYPLQRAAGFAGYLKNRSKRMSNLLASESMGYIEKVSGMWTGTRKHYGEDEGVISAVDPEDEEQGCDYGDRFRAHFALPATEKLQATYFGHLHRVLPVYGKMYISNRKFCFRSLLPGTHTKMILPLKDIENVEKEKGFRFGYSGLVVIIRGHEELFFEFSSTDARDDCAVTLHQGLESIRYLVESGTLAPPDREDAEAAHAEHLMLQEARLEGNTDDDLRKMAEFSQVASSESSPILFDDPRASIVNFKPKESLKITCLTIGSRGDIQPYIALCKGLLAEGHQPKIATHREFEPWVRKHGIEFAPVEGDPAELMRICVENGMFTYSFLKEASAKFRGWIDDLLTSSWASCQGCDLLIESPSAMGGIHIAEALRVPYFRAFTMPWTRTRAYPHAFAVPDRKMGGAYNYISYVMFDNVFWKAIAGQVNRWRKKELGLPSTGLDRMQQNKVPFLYNFSPSVVPPPLDYSDWIRVTGYWFLDEMSGWEPPTELEAFINQARKDGKKIVYIGFGSIVVSDPTALTKTVVESVLKADVRCILSKGWSDRLGDPTSTKAEIPLPPEIHQISSAPHDWLFSRLDAVAHHGGAGTTGASLRAGVPTIIKPFFGDQFFFGGRVEDLGVGICMRKLNVGVFSRALWEATRSKRMIVKAQALGEQIRKEDGVGNAIQALYRDLEYATTLVRQRSDASNQPKIPDHESSPEDDSTNIEDAWTIIH